MLNNPRKYSLIDQVCLNLDQAVRGISGVSNSKARSYPAANEVEPDLTVAQRNYSAALMRVNHAGEVCAQALYHGQALVSRDPKVQEKMHQAALEEGDHLQWCHRRLRELASHTSYLNPFWYLSSLTIGMIAGIAGDRWSLGFLAETEQQVVKHLDEHLRLLPKQDQKSLKVLKQMQEDEAQHRDDALKLGAAELPSWIKQLMRFTSKIMVKTAARI